MKKIIYGVSEFDFDACVHLMDHEIREELHARDWDSEPEPEQAFFDAYCEAHLAKYGQRFAV